MVSHEAWAAAIEDSNKPDQRPDGAYTMAELGEMLNFGPTAIKKHVRKLINADKVQITRISVRDASGRKTWTPAYILKEKDKKK